jgi:hypothetical protein
LYADEKLLWAGKPSPMRVLMQSAHRENVTSTLLIVFLLTFFLLVFADHGITSITIANVQIPLSSLVLIPIAWMAATLSYGYWRATQIIYAVTSRRALIMKQTIDGQDILAYNIIPYIERHTHADGKGDLIFATQTYSPWFYTNYARSGTYFYRIRPVGFFGIDNAREVEELMVKTFNPKRI